MMYVHNLPSGLITGDEAAGFQLAGWQAFPTKGLGFGLSMINQRCVEHGTTLGAQSKTLSGTSMRTESFDEALKTGLHISRRDSSTIYINALVRKRPEGVTLYLRVSGFRVVC